MALCYALSWLALGRAVTPRVLAAAGFIAIAGALSAGLALFVDRLLAGRSWTARFAAALLILSAGPVALDSLFLAVQMAWATHAMNELPFRLVVIILAYTSLATLYNFFSIAGFLLLPLGLPATVIFALLIARGTR